MTRSERERLIERYLSGEMTPRQEEDFFIQAALDTELRMELKAHRAIDTSVARQNESYRGIHSAMRDRVAAMAALNPPPVVTPAVDSATAPSSGSTPWLGWLASGLLTLGIVGFFLLRGGEDGMTPVRPLAPDTAAVAPSSAPSVVTRPDVDAGEGNIEGRTLSNSTQDRRDERRGVRETQPRETQAAARRTPRRLADPRPVRENPTTTSSQSESRLREGGGGEGEGRSIAPPPTEEKREDSVPVRIRLRVAPQSTNP